MLSPYLAHQIAILVVCCMEFGESRNVHPKLYYVFNCQIMAKAIFWQVDYVLDVIEKVRCQGLDHEVDLSIFDPVNKEVSYFVEINMDLAIKLYALLISFVQY